MGILRDPAHPLFAHFPTAYHSDWQWWELIHGSEAMVLNNLAVESPAYIGETCTVTLMIRAFCTKVTWKSCIIRQRMNSVIKISGTGNGTGNGTGEADGEFELNNSY